ncbi:DNA polymerase III subunit alpha [Methylobacterium brachiatum]
MTDRPFVHLNVFSDFSFAHSTRGVSGVKELVARAAALGQPALALTDDMNMYGVYKFSAAAADKGVQPIVGTKIWLRAGGTNVFGTMQLLAASETGYRNICRLLKLALFPDADGKLHEHKGRSFVPLGPLISAEYSEDVVCLSGGRDGFLSKVWDAAHQNAPGAADWLAWVEDPGGLPAIFGDRFMFEICRNGDETEKDFEREAWLLDTAARLSRPAVATTQVLYAGEERHDTLEILAAVARKETGMVQVGTGTLNPRIRSRYHMRSDAEMRELFADLPVAYDNTLEVARCTAFKVSKRKPRLPSFTDGSGRSERDELVHQSRTGLEERFLELGTAEEAKGEYRERLEYELGVIGRMGFDGYFLIVSDFIKWALAHDVPVGPGRGSGAGSLVAYALRITNLDPLRFGLLFERFLNPDRVSMPDFDIDFCIQGRASVVQYVRERYGSDLVSQIASFGEIKSKTAIKDAGRVLTHERDGGYGYSETDGMTKLVPVVQGNPIPLRKAYSESPDFRAFVDASVKSRTLFDNAQKIEGLYRQRGVHAAGIIIGDMPLEDLLPVAWNATDRMPIAQFDLKGAEDVGLVKFDFLGLETLSVLKLAVSYAKEFRGVDIDFAKVPLDDAGVYEIFARGMTNAIFQFESGGMKRALRDMKPTCIEDLIAANALYRPGPMEMIPLYNDCKNGRQEPDFPEPRDKTKPILAETHGIMVYQEQVMAVARAVAGYSLGQADLLRRAMGKKIKAEMDAQKAGFVEGARKLGTSARTAEELFDKIAKFAEYGFNKSHSAAYAVIAYQTGWLKKHFPHEFYSAVLSFESAGNNVDKMSLVKEDLDAFGIPLLPPDVNRSVGRFTPERSDAVRGVRFGLLGIKGMSGGIDQMVAERETNGPFRSVADFGRRTAGLFNRTQIENLAAVGAFSGLAIVAGGPPETNRAKAAAAAQFFANGAKRDAKSSNQFGLFAAEETAREELPADMHGLLEWPDIPDREYRAVGFYFNQHPLKMLKPRMAKADAESEDMRVGTRGQIYEVMTARRESETPVAVVAMIEGVHKKTTDRGPRLDVEASDMAGNYRFFVYPNRRSQTKSLDEMYAILDAARASRQPAAVHGRMVWQPDDPRLHVDDVMPAKDFLAAFQTDVRIDLDPRRIRLGLAEMGELRQLQQTAAEARARLDRAEPGTSEEAIRRRDVQDAEAAVDVRRAALLEVAEAARFDQVLGMIEAMRLPPHSKEGVRIDVFWTQNGQKQKLPFEGRFGLTTSRQKDIEAVDIVDRVREYLREEVKTEPAPGTARPRQNGVLAAPVVAAARPRPRTPTAPPPRVGFAAPMMR